MNSAAQPELSHLREIDNRLAPIMFGLAIGFLMVLAALIVVWVDIPRVVELATIDTGADSSARQSHAQDILEKSQRSGEFLSLLLLFMWPLFIIESLFHGVMATRSGATRKQLVMRALAALVPPLRLGTPSTAWQGRLWLPVLDWQHPGKRLSLTLARFFGKPMIAIALLILPILLLEFVFKTLVAEHQWLQILIHIATGFIWFAFAVEFILMVNATDRKLGYIKKNWIDLAIILLPLISFLRSIRALRLAKLAKVQQLAKMGRIYRMRGLGMKLFRALLLFEIVNSVLRITPEKKLAKLQDERNERLEELAEIDAEIEEVQQTISELNDLKKS